MDFMSMKSPLTPAGIEQAAFRFVAQHLKHCAIRNIKNTLRGLLQAFFWIYQEKPEKPYVKKARFVAQRRSL